MTTVSKDILTSLDWTDYMSVTIESANIVRIDAVTKQMIVTINDEFELEINNTVLNVITYTLNTGITMKLT